MQLGQYAITCLSVRIAFCDEAELRYDWQRLIVIFLTVLCHDWLSARDARFSSSSSPLMRPRPSPARRCDRERCWINAWLDLTLSKSADQLLVEADSVTEYATDHWAVCLKKRNSRYTVRIIISDFVFGLRAPQSFGRAIRPGFHCICD